MAALFGTRSLDYRGIDEESHLRDLADAIGTAKAPQFLDPITIWWGGDRYYVIDGHMRLRAYASKGIAKGIPVEIFEGSLDDAMAQSAILNSKNQLPMTTDDRLNCAWRLVLVSDLSKKKIAKSCAVGNGSLGNMRKVKAHFMDELGKSLQDLCDMTWKDARYEAAGHQKKEPSDFDAEMQKRALRFSKDIARAVGPRIFQDPEAFALALSMMDKRLPKMLMQSFEWDDALRETIVEMRTEMDEADELSEHWEQQQKSREAAEAARLAEWGEEEDY
nr:ParB/RepB/Spo0J family partition protein [uncultured Cohaesibacter sp.]